MPSLSRPWGRSALLLSAAGAVGGVHQTDAPVHLADSRGHVGRFHEYIQAHDRQYAHGSEEYHRRLALFQRRVAEIDRHNSNPKKHWTAAVNKLTDRTHEELSRLRGYRRAAHPNGGSGGRRQTASFMGVSARSRDL